MSKDSIFEAESGDVKVIRRHLSGSEGELELEIGGWVFTVFEFREYVASEPQEAVDRTLSSIKELVGELAEAAEALREWRARKGWE